MTSAVLSFRSRVVRASTLVEWEVWDDFYRRRKMSLIHSTRPDDSMMTYCGLYLPASTTFRSYYDGPMLCRRCGAHRDE